MTSGVADDFDICPRHNFCRPHKLCSLPRKKISPPSAKLPLKVTLLASSPASNQGANFGKKTYHEQWYSRTNGKQRQFEQTGRNRRGRNS